jgi:hypothetical protein
VSSFVRVTAITDPYGGVDARRNANWARLMQEVYEVDPLECPSCGATMRIIVLIEDADIVERILKHLKTWDPLPDTRSPAGPDPPWPQAETLPISRRQTGIPANARWQQLRPKDSTHFPAVHRSICAIEFPILWVGRVIGVLTLTPYDLWRYAHALHHASSGNLDRPQVGGMDTLTMRAYRALPPLQRLRYRLYRHPFGPGPGYVFLLRHCLPVGFMRAG